MKPIVRTVPASVTMSLDLAARELTVAGRDIINLTAGQVDLPMPDEGKAALTAALEADRTGYVPATGSADLKEAVRRKNGWTDGQILISSGAKPLLFAAIGCILGPGDEVLLPTPCYTSYPEMIRLFGAVPVPVPCRAENGFTVTRDDLEHSVTSRTKALLLNHPTNPTGAVYDADALRAIVEFSMAHDLWLIADEVYGAFVYEDVFVSLYSFPEVRDRLILVNSASKTYAMAGLRLGYAVASEQVAAAMSGFLSHAVGCPCSLSERAAIAVLSLHDTWTDALREIFRTRRDLLWSAVSGIPQLHGQKSAGAFYLWLSVKKIDGDDVRFCRRLLDAQGVAITPGSAFLCPGYVRIAYTQDTPLLLDAAARLNRFCEQS